MKKRGIVWVLVGCALFCNGWAAQAATQEDKKTSVIEDLLNWPVETVSQTGEVLTDTIFNLGSVHVSGSRLRSRHSEELATDVPESVTVLNEHTLRVSGSDSLSEAIGSAEGVSYTDDLGQGLGSRIDLRGFGGEAKQALVLFDGVRAVEPFDNSTAWSLYPSEFLKQVEIRRGGASTLYGEGALSGVIRLETKDPTLEPHVAAESSWGSYRQQKDFVEGSGTLNGMGMYVGGLYETTDGYRQNSSFETGNALVKTTALITEFFDVANAFYYVRSDTGIPGPLLPAEVARDRRQKDPDGQFGDKFEDELIQDGLTVNYFAEPIGIEFSDLIGFRSREQDSVQSFGGAFPGTSFNKIGTETFSNVFQGSGSFEAGPVLSETSAGLEWSIDDIHNPFTFDDKTFGPFSSERSIDRRLMGYFGQNRLTFWKKFIVETGVRYDDIDWNIYDLLTPKLQKTKTADHLSPKLALEYKLADALSIFGGISESFKAPDSNALIFETPNIFTPNPNVDPSVARHREIGVRYAHPTFGSLRAVYFNIDTKKEILFNDITNTNENFDTQRQGVELAGEWAWSETFQTFARYAYTRAEFDGRAFDGKDIPLVPRHKWSAGFVWDPDTHWNITGQAGGVRDQFALNDFNNLFPADDYWTVDGRVGYRYKNLELFVKVQNILGETYSSFVSSNAVDTVNYNPAPRQSVQAGVRIEI